MDFMDQLLELLKMYGPAMAVLVVGYYRANSIESKNKERIAELEKKLMQNKLDVEKENLGLSSDDIISKSISKKPGT